MGDNRLHPLGLVLVGLGAAAAVVLMMMMVVVVVVVVGVILVQVVDEVAAFGVHVDLFNVRLSVVYRIGSL